MGTELFRLEFLVCHTVFICMVMSIILNGAIMFEYIACCAATPYDTHAAQLTPCMYTGMGC